MGYAQESGYTPTDIATMMLSVMANVNAQFGTSYTAETFIGTGFYKYYYALMQRLQENEIKTSEIFLNLQNYFTQTNAKISRPVVTNPGLIEALGTGGFKASVKAPIIGDAGKIFVCVDTDDGVHASGNCTITSYANLLTVTPDTVVVGATTFTAQSGAVTPGDATFRAATDNATTAISLAAQINAHATAGALVKATVIGAVVTISAINGGTGGNAIALAYHDLGTSTIGATVSGAFLTGGTTNSAYAANELAIATIIKDSTVAGCVTQGTQSTTIVLSNGQSFAFKFNLPNRLTVLLRLTTTLSVNNQVVIKSPADVKAALIANIEAKYALGKNFEPQKYFNVNDDAPWASDVLLEYSLDNGGSYSSSVYSANYDDLFTILLANVTLVED